MVSLSCELVTAISYFIFPFYHICVCLVSWGHIAQNCWQLAVGENLQFSPVAKLFPHLFSFLFQTRWSCRFQACNPPSSSFPSILCGCMFPLFFICASLPLLFFDDYWNACLLFALFWTSRWSDVPAGGLLLVPPYRCWVYSTLYKTGQCVRTGTVLQETYSTVESNDL